MARRGDGIRKRCDGRWEGRYAIGRKANGAVRYASVYANSYTAVKKKLTERKAYDPISTALPSPKNTFSEVAAQWQSANALRLKPSTQAKYMYLLETHILRQIGSIPIQVLDSSAVHAFLKQKSEHGRICNATPLSAAYVSGIRMVILAVLRFSVENGICQPTKGQIYRPQLIKKETHLLAKPAQRILENYIMQARIFGP